MRTQETPMRVLSDIHEAMAFLTIAPGPKLEREPTLALTPWFPWVGAVIGIMTVAPLIAIDAVNADSGRGELLERGAVLFAAVVVAVQHLLSRLIHFTGLAAVADAWWGGDTPVLRTTRLVADSIGTKGGAAVALATFVCISSVAVILGSGQAVLLLAAIPVLGRFSAMFGTWFGVVAHPQERFFAMIGRPKVTGLLIAVIAAAALGYGMFHFYGREGLMWAAAGLFIALTVPHQLAERFRGVTREVITASVLVTEMLCLVIAAVWLSW